MSVAVNLPKLEPRLYRPREVSELLGVPLASVYVWIKNSEIKTTKIGGRFFVTPNELTRILGLDTELSREGGKEMPMQTVREAANDARWIRWERRLLRVLILGVTACVLVQIYHHHH
jgi:excisionase family DNA binding protein